VYERQQNSKQNFNTKLDGVRRVGRLKMRWEDGVDQDMRILEVKNPLGRPRRRWEDNSKMDLQEVGGGRGDWMEPAQDRDRWRALVGTVRDFRVPLMRGIS